MHSRTSAKSQPPRPPSPRPLSPLGSVGSAFSAVSAVSSDSESAVSVTATTFDVFTRQKVPSRGETIHSGPEYTLETHPFYPPAAAGDPSAQYNLAVALLNGDAVVQDVKQGQSWLASAAKQGHVMALHFAGLLHLSAGALKEAASCFYTSATKGYAPSLFQLGKMYAQGKGVSKDRERAICLLKMAAKQGDADSMMYLVDIMPEVSLAHRLALMKNATHSRVSAA